MPTTEVPLIPGICTSQTNLTLYWSQINLAFELIVNTAEEEQGIELTLPGIPLIPLAGMPSITIPKLEAAEIPLRLRRPPGVKGYVGNVYPVSQGGKGVGGKFGLPGFPGFSVEGIPPGMLPGVDPSTYTMEWLNKNYEIIATTLEEEGITFEPIVIPQVDICETVPGTTSPGAVLVTQLVNQNNQTIIGALTGCVFGAFPAFDAVGAWAFGSQVQSGASTVFTTGNGTYTVPSPIGDPPSFHMDATPPGANTRLVVVGNYVFPTTPGSFNDLEAIYDTSRQPLVCGHGFTISFDMLLVATYANIGIDNINVNSTLQYILPDNTRTHINGLNESLGSTTHAGSLTFNPAPFVYTVASGVVPSNGRLIINFRGGTTNSGVVTDLDLYVREFTFTDTGP